MCTPGVSYTVSAWVYSPTGWSAVFPNINFYNSGQTFLSSGSSSFNIPANTWTFISGTYTAPLNGVFLTIDLGEASTPGASNLLYADNVMVTETSGGPQFSSVLAYEWAGTWPGSGLWPPSA